MEEKKAISITMSYTPTPAEIEIVQELGNDMRPKEIAAKRGNSFKTVESHIAAIKKKCGKKTIGGLVYIFYKNQLID